MDLALRRCTIAEIRNAPNIGDMMAEYAAESATPEFGQTVPQWAIYEAAEAAGLLHPIAAFDGAWLAGTIFPVLVTLPHYGALAATVESFFVAKAYRPHGVGLSLLACAEALAREHGCRGLLVSSPAGGVLAQVMRKRHGYRLNNEVFVRALG